MARLLLLALLLLAASLAPPPPALAQQTAPAGAVESVIRDQIDAFRAGDLERAFGHASPSIQGLFRTPAIFGRMVENGYPMVWRPERLEFGALTRQGGGWRQVVTIVDGAGRWHEATYEMQLIDGVWRINGVTLETLPGLSS